MPGVIIFDPDDPNAAFSVGNDQAAAVYSNIEADEMYLSDLSNILEWAGNSATQQLATWKSGYVRLPRPMNMGAVVVQAESYAQTTFKLYASLSGTMTLITSIGITSNDPIRLPGGYVSSLYQIELITSDRITSISVGESIFDVTEG
jgi:hypothetical protein